MVKPQTTKRREEESSTSTPRKSQRLATATSSTEVGLGPSPSPSHIPREKSTPRKKNVENTPVKSPGRILRQRSLSQAQNSPSGPTQSLPKARKSLRTLTNATKALIETPKKTPGKTTESVSSDSVVVTATTPKKISRTVAESTETITATPKKTHKKSSNVIESAAAVTPVTPKKTPAKVTSAAPPKSPFKSPGKFESGVWRFNSLGVPKCPLPCRESQFEDIWKFLHDNISTKNSRCMYVSGVPGTGKTVIVKSVVDTLARYANERKKHLEFQYAYINGLSLGSPDKIWKRFYCELERKKQKLTPATALKKLGNYFETSGRLPTVLVIDELDQILDKRQSILYQLLEWTSHASNMFTLIAIFNTMSLPENGLVMRNVSRMSLMRCIFPPYTHEQLQTIVKSSLASCKSEKIKDDAIVLLSRKVAAVSGDARRALEIAKRAVEIVESGQATGVKAVDAAFKEIFSSPKIETMKNCSSLEQMFLKTLSAELHSTGTEETTMMSVYGNLCPSAAYEGMSWTVDQFLNAGIRLSLMKLIICEKESSSIHKKISLNVPIEDINFALGLKSSENES